MSVKKMIFTGEKESFIIRVLMNKLEDAGISCAFAPFRVNDIGGAGDEDTLIALYIEEDSKPKEDVLHYLSDTLEEKNSQMILIGEQRDIAAVLDEVPGDIIYKTFIRPVDNTEFVSEIKNFFFKLDAGDFKKSILVVDDDPQYLALVRQWLNGTYKVSMVNSGLQAIKFLGKNKVDLILLDHEMPGTTGPQVLEMLRSDAETRDIPVMFLTGKGDKASVMQVVALRPDGYFLKSIEKDELLEKLHEFFQLRKA